MIFSLAGNEVTLVTLGLTGTDPLGKKTYGEVSRQTLNVRLEQRGSSEDEGYVVNSFKAYMPLSVTVKPKDYVLEGTRKFEVEGTPSINKIPGFPAADHQEVQLKYVGEVS